MNGDKHRKALQDYVSAQANGANPIPAVKVAQETCRGFDIAAPPVGRKLSIQNFVECIRVWAAMRCRLRGESRFELSVSTQSVIIRALGGVEVRTYA